MRSLITKTYKFNTLMDVNLHKHSFRIDNLMCCIKNLFFFFYINERKNGHFIDSHVSVLDLKQDIKERVIKIITSINKRCTELQIVVT